MDVELVSTLQFSKKATNRRQNTGVRTLPDFIASAIERKTEPDTAILDLRMDVAVKTT
jgi:hypothetical protein